ncbi:lysoplasmalogenase family protein [Parasediminibacterium sp. JCM 36343]|uniref:lysoplasmalogenase family protein n=1 Tax=Parasediminibacterium sp. JCM 36343 TaxID=3374279 RepID=UPI00397AB824
MTLVKSLFFGLYWVLLLVGCYFVFDEDLKVGNIFSSALMPVLIVYLYLHLKETHSKTLKIYFFTALVLSWVGDFFKTISIDTSKTNDINNVKYTIYGIVACVIANLCYAFAFKKIRPIKISKAVLPSLVTIACMLTIFAVFHVLPHKTSGILYNPLMVYLVSLSLPAVFASNILDSNARKKLALNYFLPAAVLSILSGSLFILNKFKIFEPKIDAVVLLLYGYAQMIYVNGFRKTAK